jgi:hypothetical protein
MACRDLWHKGSTVHSSAVHRSVVHWWLCLGPRCIVGPRCTMDLCTAGPWCIGGPQCTGPWCLSGPRGIGPLHTREETCECQELWEKEKYLPTGTYHLTITPAPTVTPFNSSCSPVIWAMWRKLVREPTTKTALISTKTVA